MPSDSQSKANRSEPPNKRLQLTLNTYQAPGYQSLHVPSAPGPGQGNARSWESPRERGVYREISRRPYSSRGLRLSVLGGRDAAGGTSRMRGKWVDRKRIRRGEPSVTAVLLMALVACSLYHVMVDVPFLMVLDVFCFDDLLLLPQ